jgi:hypothetical protein
MGQQMYLMGQQMEAHNTLCSFFLFFSFQPSICCINLQDLHRLTKRLGALRNAQALGVGTLLAYCLAFFFRGLEVPEFVMLSAY